MNLFSFVKKLLLLYILIYNVNVYSQNNQSKTASSQLDRTGNRNQTGRTSQSSTSGSSATVARSGQTSTQQSSGGTAASTPPPKTSTQSPSAGAQSQARTAASANPGRSGSSRPASGQGSRTVQSASTQQGSSAQAPKTGTHQQLSSGTAETRNSSPPAKIGTQQIYSGQGASTATTPGRTGQTNSTTPTVRGQPVGTQASSTAAARTGLQSYDSTPSKTGTQPVSSSSPPKSTPISTDSDSNSQSPGTKTDITKKKIQLDINKTSGTHEFDYEKKSKSAIYTAKDGSTFELVKEDKTEIWKTDDSTEYSNRVEVFFNKESKAVSIHLNKNKNKLFIRNAQNQPWKDIDLTEVNPRPVNISYEHDTYFYINELNDKVRTFTAKNGFAFKAVSEYVNSKIIEVWKTDKSDEYCTEILKTNYRSENMTDITLTLANKTRKRFIKVEVEPPGCQCNTSFCCFITCGLSGWCCKSKVLTWKELDLTKPIPVMLDIDSKHQRYEFSIKNEVGSQVFEAKEGYAFNRVVKSCTKIWNTTKESEYSSKVIRKDKDEEVIVNIGMGDKAKPNVYKRTALSMERYDLKS